jgi:recombination protein RecR
MLGSLPSFDRLVAELTKLPGIGGKTAARLAFHLLRAPRADSEALAEALREMKQNVLFCSRCFHITETDPCALCSDPARDDGRLTA